ncbi:hypothetical protein GGP50_002576 [Salinibacter ruber]|uniref:hypothetical protein n=1 Tax=Salinibacter ruber TaxID=146919 RepID=UPI0021690A46|nr:hypothetical protein [Salinibacter ruber]MCS4194350.1 hypothetical protein [Salinibacter ruber]
MFQPDPDKKTIQVPVQIEDGSVQIDTDALPEDIDLGEDLPSVDGSAKGVLRFPAKALSDEEEHEELVGTETEKLFSAGDTVWLKMRVKRREDLSQPAAEYLKHVDPPRHGKHGVLLRVRLKEDLHLRRRGLKKAELVRCGCLLPEDLPEELERLPDDFDPTEPLPTLHQAFMRLSEVFERHRDTHNGNVFKKGFVENENYEEDPVEALLREEESNIKWMKLDNFR